MNNIINSVNLFFNKISKGQHQFQLSDNYLLPKKETSKTRQIKKDQPSKKQLSPDELKNMKNAFKKYKLHQEKSSSFAASSSSTSQLIQIFRKKTRLNSSNNPGINFLKHKRWNGQELKRQRRRNQGQLLEKSQKKVGKKYKRAQKEKKDQRRKEVSLYLLILRQKNIKNDLSTNIINSIKGKTS